MAEATKIPRGELIQEAARLAAQAARSVTPREMQARFDSQDRLTGQAINTGDRILYGASNGVGTAVRAEHGEQGWRLAHVADQIVSGKTPAGEKAREWLHALIRGGDTSIREYATEMGMPASHLARALSLAAAARELGAERLLRENLSGLSWNIGVGDEDFARVLERPQALPGGYRVGGAER